MRKGLHSTAYTQEGGPVKPSWGAERGVASMLFSNVSLAGNRTSAPPRGAPVGAPCGVPPEEPGEPQPVDSASIAASIARASQEMGDLPPLCVSGAPSEEVEK